MKNNYPKNRIFQVLSEIPLDIEGSNLSNTGWYPHDIDKEYMNDKQIAEAISEAQNRDRKVLFKNVFLDYDHCDCNDGMCSHGSWVYEIVVMEGEKRYEIELEEDYMIADYESRAEIPLKCTVYDFYRMCELVGIPLQFSEYAKSLLNN